MREDAVLISKRDPSKIRVTLSNDELRIFERWGLDILTLQDDGSNDKDFSVEWNLVEKVAGWRCQLEEGTS